MKPLLLAFMLIALSTGCGSDCEGDADPYRPMECAIKVQSQNNIGIWFSIEGTNIDNGNRNRYSDMGTWYLSFKDSVAVGDTVIKRKNELEFSIHKKDTVLVFPFECDGKIIK